MTIVRSLKAALAATVCLLPLHALAQSTGGSVLGGYGAAMSQPGQPTNWVTLGGQYASSGSWYLNQYSGNESPGFYGIGDLHYGWRDAWDSGGTRYLDVQGDNLGFQDRSFTAKVGQQGTWGLTLSYDGIHHEEATGFPSVWQSNGAVVPGIGGAGIPLAFPSAPAFPTYTLGNGVKIASVWLPVPSSTAAGQLYTYNLGTQRDIFTGVGTYQWGEWTITGAIRHEHKTGYLANSLEIGGTAALTQAGSTNNTTKPAATSGALTSGIGYFAQPIDYDTDRYDLTAAYSTERFQAQLGYTFSNFTDNLAQFNAQNPFGFGSLSNFAVGGITPTAASISAPYSLPPSNSAHQIKVMLGYNLSPTTRVNANFEYGLEMQNDSYPTGTGDPLNNPTQPRSSLGGLVQTLYGNIAMTAQPMPKMDVRLSYTIDNRSNQTSSNAYVVDTRSNNSTTGNGDCSAGCFNLPYSFNHQTMTAEGSYRILPQTKVILNDTFETMYRSYADASFVTTNTATAKIRSMVMDDVFGSVSYSHQDRQAHNDNNGATWSLLAPSVGGNEPGFVMFFESSRRHDELKGTLDVSPTNTLTASLMVKYSRDVYPNGQYGLRNNHNVLVGPDLSWQVTPALMAHAYYSYQQIYYDQNALYTTAGNGSFSPTTGTSYFVPWTAQTTDSVHTVGVAADWQVIKDVLKISFDYNLSYGDTAYALGDGGALIGGAITSPTTIAALNFQPLPDVTSMLNMIQIRGEYTFRPDMTVIFGYAFEKFSYKDFMYTAAPTQYANALLPGTLSPNAAIHVVGAGLRIRF